MKSIIAFFMAWGNFITLPCPYKRWDNDLKNRMLAFLPAVGGVIGILWVLLVWVLRQIDAWHAIPTSVGAVIVMAYIFLICGFMHLDGFMDCNDAILSRRPLEKRQEILKDSNVGAFAVVTLALLLIAWYACMTACWRSTPLGYFLLLPVWSRFISGISVLRYKPIGHSQYVKDYTEPGKGKYILAMCLQVAVLVGLCYLLPDFHWTQMVAFSFVTVVAGEIAGIYARKQLGGMSGDIAGYMICWAELAGIFTLAVL